MAVFTRSTVVPAAPEALFDFHQNPHNLRAIAPAGLRILGIDADVAARRGDLFAVVVGRGPLVVRWIGEWETVDPPHLLVDTGIRCPFSLWRHHHVFEAHDEGAVLIDRVEFRLAWSRGGPLGDLLCRTVIFPRMFAARHEATRRHFARDPL